MSLERRLRALEAQADEPDEELPHPWGMSALLRLHQRYLAQGDETDAWSEDEGEPTGLQMLLRAARAWQAEQR